MVRITPEFISHKKGRFVRGIMIFQVRWKWGGNGGVEVVLSGVDVDLLLFFLAVFLKKQLSNGMELFYWNLTLKEKLWLKYNKLKWNILIIADLNLRPINN